MVNRQAQSDYNGSQINAFVSARYDIPAGSYTIAPGLAASYSTIDIDPFVEIGAQSLNLESAEVDLNVAQLRPSIRIERAFENANGASFLPYFSVGANLEVGDQEGDALFAFSQTTTPFVIKSGSQTVVQADIGAGLNVLWKNTLFFIDAIGGVGKMASRFL